MTFNIARVDQRVHSKQGSSRLWSVDSSGLRTPVGTRPTGEFPEIITRTRWASISAGVGDFASAAADNTWLTLPIGRFPAPSLRRNVLVKWDILGDYSNPTPNSESLEAQLMVDSAAVDSALAYAQTAAVTTTGSMRFTADLTTIGNLVSPRFLMHTKMQIVDSSGALVIATEKFMYSTINPINEQTLSWRIRKTLASGSVVLNIHSVLCYQICPQTGF